MTAELVRVATEQRRCALYRHYDDADVLLYIGISETLIDRTNSGHARSSEWAQYAERAEAQWYDSRERAARAERESIQGEIPVFNRQHAVGDVDGRIGEYLRQRELRILKRQLNAYRNLVHVFLSELPEDVFQAAMEATHDYYKALDVPVDDVFEAYALRHVNQVLDLQRRRRDNQIRLEGYEFLQWWAAERAEEIKNPPQYDSEPPF